MINSVWAHSAEHISLLPVSGGALKNKRSYDTSGDTQTAKGKFIPNDQEGISLSCLKCILIRTYMYVCMYPCEASLFISMYMYVCIRMYVCVCMYIPVWRFSLYKYVYVCMYMYVCEASLSWDIFSLTWNCVQPKSLYLINYPLGPWPPSLCVSVVSLTQSRVLRRQSQWWTV